MRANTFLTIRSRRSATSLAGVALLLGAAGAATVSVPIAQADSTLSVVRGHVRSADAALHKVAAAAATGSVVGGPLAVLEGQIRAAGRDSAKLYRHAHHAHSSAVSVRAASALTKLAGQESRDAAVLTPLVGQLGGSGQTDLASFIASVTQGREQALSLVSQLIGQLPAPAQSTVAGIVAQLSSASTGQVGQLAGAISPGSVACPAIDAVSQVVATVLASVQADLTRVQSIVSILPAGALSQFTTVINGLPAELTSLVASIKQAFNCPTTASTTPPVTGLPAVTGIVSGPLAIVGTVVDSVVQLVQSLLASFLPSIGPGVTSGATPPSVSVPAPVSGLLSQVTSLVPGLGSLFGSGSGGGLLGGLLGGFGG